MLKTRLSGCAWGATHTPAPPSWVPRCPWERHLALSWLTLPSLSECVYVRRSHYQGQGGGLYGEEVLIVHLRAAAPHELGEAEQVLHVEPGGPPAEDDLRCDLTVRGGAQVDGVVRGGDVHQGQQLVVSVLVRLHLPLPCRELAQLQDVAPTHGLPGV